MTEEELDAICDEIGDTIIKLYADLCKRVPKGIVLTVFTGGFCVFAAEAGASRATVLAAINSAFDDTEFLQREDK